VLISKLGQFNNHTITGTGGVNVGCGEYNFTIEGSSSASTTVVPSPSKTGKPQVGSSSLGTSGASLVRLSGSMMVGVAGIFVCFL
jgi:hypothetical protein